MSKLSARNSHAFLSESREEDEVDFRDYGAPYLSGHGFSLRCARWFSVNRPTLGVNPERDNDHVYVKTDHLPQFFGSSLVPASFVLVTHNSDFVVGSGHLRFLDDPRLRLWLALNKGIDHPKLKSIPDGLQNPCSGGEPRLAQAIGESGDGTPLPNSGRKREMFYANYTIDSRVEERARCAAACQPQGITLHGRAPLAKYLADMSCAHFALCPAGSGVDSCRPWEALCVKTIPVVTRCFTYAEHQDFPMVVLDDWSKFDAGAFSADLYRALWGKFDPSLLLMDGYCARLNRTHGTSL